jgi:hypothetical protein
MYPAQRKRKAALEQIFQPVVGILIDDNDFEISEILTSQALKEPVQLNRPSKRRDDERDFYRFGGHRSDNLPTVRIMLLIKQ